MNLVKSQQSNAEALKSFQGSVIVKFARYLVQGKTAYGIVEENSVRQIIGSPFTRYRSTDQVHPLSQVRLLAPCTPSKALCMAVNYKSHVGTVAGSATAELPKQPEPFFKVPSAIIGPEEPIIIPKVFQGRTDEEGELVVVIGKRCKGVSREAALDYVLGYTAGNDVSARDWQRGDRQWWRAKSSDTFAPIGPFIETDLDPFNIDFRIILNGKEVRPANTRDLAYDIPTCISFISQVVTLEPGDLIFTGTPGTPAQIRPGDVVAVEVKGIGALRNPVRGEE